jgi:hypothetical protein
MANSSSLEIYDTIARDLFFRYGLESDEIQSAELMHRGFYHGVLFFCQGWSLKCLFSEAQLVLKDSRGEIRETPEITSFASQADGGAHAPSLSGPTLRRAA